VTILGNCVCPEWTGQRETQMGERNMKLTYRLLSGAAVVMGLATASAAHAEYKLAFIPGVGGDAYYGSVQCGIEAAAKSRGAMVDTQAPKSFDPAAQIPILEAMIAKKPDAIVIAPTDSKALFAPLKKAADQGIKVVLVDTTLEDPSIAVSEVSSDNVEAGRVAAAELAEGARRQEGFGADRQSQSRASRRRTTARRALRTRSRRPGRTTCTQQYLQQLGAEGRPDRLGDAAIQSGSRRDLLDGGLQHGGRGCRACARRAAART
jgi:hypothetical protein